MSQVFSFAEETCWKGEHFREIRKKVVFRLFSVGRNLGTSFCHEFEHDYSLWYDQEDSDLLDVLEHLVPTVSWRRMVFHKKIDMSSIEIYETETDRLVAIVEVRGSERARRRRPEVLEGDNVILFEALPAMREAILARQREREESRDSEN